MTDRDAIRDRILELARQELRLDAPIPDDVELAEHLDSVQRLTLVVAIEDAFRIDFDPEDEAEVRTLAQVVDRVARKVDRAV